MASTSPVATITLRASTLRIVHSNKAACDSGIQPGQTLSDAKAIAPSLITYNHDPASDRCCLESLAIFGNRFSPLVHIEGDDSLVLDVTGWEKLFKGEHNLLGKAIRGLESQGFGVRGAIADSLGAAWALAHAHPEPDIIAPRGQTAAELAPLPIWSLRIDTTVVQSLMSLGVETIASLLHLPRSSLVSRFGDKLLQRIDQALGDEIEMLSPYRPPVALTSRIRLGACTTRIETLHEATRRVTEIFVEKLARRVAGVRQIFITFHCPDVTTENETQSRNVTREVNLSQPTRSAKHLYSLLRVSIESLRLPGPTDELTLWAKQIDSLDNWQDELFVTDVRDTQELGDLLDRLAVRLGPEAVVRALPVSDHQPERAFTYVSAVGNHTASLQDQHRPFRKSPQEDPVRKVPRNPHRSNTASTIQSDAGNTSPAHRPLRLLPRPLAIIISSVIPEGPPIVFLLHGTRHTVMECTGPERIETGWWRGAHLKRDYYRITSDQGRRCWIFRDRQSGRWYLHGWFD